MLDLVDGVTFNDGAPFKRVRNHVDGLLTTPKFHPVWLETGSG